MDQEINQTMVEFAEYLAGKGLSKRTMQDYLRYFKHFNEGLKKEDLSQAYINRFILKHTSNVTRSFLKNLFDHLDLDFKVPKLTGRRPKKKRRSISPQEIKVLRSWIFRNKKLRILCLFDLSYYCALRRHEVLGIRLRDFNWKEWIEDRRSPCRLLIRGKGSKERIVVVSPKIMKNIVDYIDQTDKGMDDLLFDFNRNKWQDAFKQAVKKTMDYNFTLHDLRRSRATYWLKRGVDLIRVKNRLGHDSVETTQRYINLDEDQELADWSKEV